MALQENSFFLQKKDNVIQTFKAALKNGILKESDLEKFLSEDNTIEEIVIEYLDKKKKKNLDKKDFIALLDKYENCIREETFNILYSEYYKKLSAIKKIFSLLTDIKDISLKLKDEEQLISIHKILELDLKKYFPTFPIIYKFNKELYFNTLYYNILKQIKQKYNKLKSFKNYKDMSSTIVKSKAKIEELLMKEDKRNESKIKFLNGLLNNIDSYFGTQFYNYIINYSVFLKNIYDNFLKRFKGNPIFENSNEDNKNIILNNNVELNCNVELNLFNDFIFFLRSYNFEKQDIIFYYQYWNDSFIHISFDNLGWEKFGELSLSKINNNLIVKNKLAKASFIINNIDDYCITPLLHFINYKEPNICNLNKFIRMDRFDSVSFIKSHWDKVSVYFCNILCSPVIISIFNAIIFKYNDSQFKSHLFLNQIEIKEIINNIRFFNFNSDFTGDTQGRIMMVYVTGNIKDNNELVVNKLIYLATLLIVLFHEIVGHVNVRYQNFLNKNKKVFHSPKPEFESDYFIKREKKIGEFVEGALFGDYKCQMTLREILFILDINNYYNYKNYKEFRKAFLQSKNLHLTNVSVELKNILKIFEINLDENFLNQKQYEKYSVQKARENKFTFPSHHSFDKLKFY